MQRMLITISRNKNKNYNSNNDNYLKDEQDYRFEKKETLI